MPKRFPARLHVLLARDDDTAVVIRRGPAKRVCTMSWDRRTDRFKLGQWLDGRIYERRCDLSPDGRHLIYFAMNGRWDTRAKGAWTAISRAPYLKALSLFAKGDCWHGGGLFLSGKDYWLNDGYGHTVLENGAPLSRQARYPWHEHYGGECLGGYYIRLQRDGWEMKRSGKKGRGNRTTVFEKRINDHWLLRKHAHATIDHPVGTGVYFDTHALVHSRTGEERPFLDWEWADVDGGRVAWAAGGKMHAARVKASGLGEPVELHDFNDMAFERIRAPY
jgi:hypothetical protein